MKQQSQNNGYSRNIKSTKKNQFHNSEYLRYVKLKLWVKDPHCHYCGIETILSHDMPQGVTYVPNMATVDHVYSKLNPLRDRVQQKFVLACNLCNNYRARLEEDKLTIEEKWDRSKRGHRDGVPQIPINPNKKITASTPKPAPPALPHDVQAFNLANKLRSLICFWPFN